MPRLVNHEQRRREIVEATLDVLAESGTRGLSFRAVAAKLGGSTSLITHYFANQQSLLDAVKDLALVEWTKEIDELDSQSDNPRQRLHNLLVWLLPVTKSALRDEQSRINLVSGAILGEPNHAMFAHWDGVIRGFLRTHLKELLPEEEVEATVELLRATTNGVTLLVVESPDAWPPDRQRAIVDHLMHLLKLAPA